MANQRKYDSTVARIAGNIASSQFGLAYNLSYASDREAFAARVVALARSIVDEVQRTEPLSEEAAVVREREK